jgi:hypothetical protein
VVALAEKSGLKRIVPALAVVMIAGISAGCSETTGSTGAPTAAAVAPARSDFVDSGQPIVLTGASPAGPADAGTATASASPASSDPAAASKKPVAPSGPKVATAQPTAEPIAAPARAATAIVEPSAEDIVAPEPQADGVTASPDGGATDGPATVISDAPPDTPAAPAGDAKISASAKAKLIGELQALKKRPGADPSAGSAKAGSATKAKCPEGSLEPQCLAAAD